MVMPMHSAQVLIEKIQSLPTDQIVEVEDFVDFLRQRTRLSKRATHSKSLGFPVDDLGSWPQGLSLRREDMYGDNGR